jgi:5-formyltetrahydrofolate cyclo-ligase
MKDSNVTSSLDDERDNAALRAYAKRELRKRMESIRNVLPRSAHADRSTRACAVLSALTEFASARTIAGYQAMRRELDPSQALQLAAAQGKRVALPRVVEDTLVFHLVTAGEELVENDWGILEPPESAEVIPLSEIDLALVPALALDLRGYRIGYGKGFYDRVLPAMTRACSVGLVYDFQLLAEVPNEAHDVPLKRVVSDTRSVACPPAQIT